MAAITLLSDKIELDANTEALVAFAGEIEVVSKGLTDLELASAIITGIDGLDDKAWEAMTMALKEWSNTINNKKIEIAEKEKKEAIAAKAQKTKKANAAAEGAAPTTPAAIKKVINDCKNKADVAEQVSLISRALEMEAPPTIAKSWTVAKQKEAAIAGLKKPKAAKTPKAEKTPKTDKPVTRTVSPSASEVKTAKDTAAKTAKDKESVTGGGIEDGEPFRKNTTAYLVWAVFSKSKAKGGVTLDTVREKFEAALKGSEMKCSNIPGRVTRVVAELKKKNFIIKLESGNYVNKTVVE